MARTNNSYNFILYNSSSMHNCLKTYNKKISTGMVRLRSLKIFVYFVIIGPSPRGCFLTPIPKECDKWNLSNYRQISFLPVFSKVFEKVAYTQLYDYLKITQACINNNMDFVLKSLILRPFCISYNTCKSIWTLVILYFLCSWIFSRHLILSQLTHFQCFVYTFIWQAE